jgi:FG-GAP-like repeat/FG-GAP repeat
MPDADGDLTHDGRPDIAIVNRYDSTLGIYINSGGSSGLLQPQATYNTGGGGGVHQVAAADINGDGWLDLGTTGVGVLWVHMNTAAGTGAVNGGTPVSYGLPGGGDGLAFGDFNGDGLPDFAGPVSGNDTVAVLLNQTADAGTAWGPEADYAVGNGPDFVATADLSGSHRLDLAVGNVPSQDVSILSGQGDGTFVPGQTVAVGDGGALTGPVLLADLNGDGAPDMIVGSSGGGDAGTAGFGVLLNANDGSGSFGAPVSYAVPGGGAATAVYDMNGDGSLDVVGVVAGSASTYTQVFVMLNQKDALATLGAPTFCAAGSYAYGAAAGDLNGDGKGDLVTANYDGTSAGTIQVILGR